MRLFPYIDKNQYYKNLKDGKLQGSNDNVSWTNLFTI